MHTSLRDVCIRGKWNLSKERYEYDILFDRWNLSKERYEYDIHISLLTDFRDVCIRGHIHTSLLTDFIGQSKATTLDLFSLLCVYIGFACKSLSRMNGSLSYIHISLLTHLIEQSEASTLDLRRLCHMASLPLQKVFFFLVSKFHPLLVGKGTHRARSRSR